MWLSVRAVKHSSRCAEYRQRHSERRAPLLVTVCHLHRSSHALLTLKLEKSVGSTVQTNSLLLVDLAGSESYNSVRPHAKINVSLLALGRVLKALAGGSSHKPYRDSVLTRLLQPILEKGGSMCMLACLNPGPEYAGETNAVLDYAKTTASIVRTVVRAEVKDLLSDAEHQGGNAGGMPRAGLNGRLAVTLPVTLPPTTLPALCSHGWVPRVAGSGHDPMEGDEFDNDDDLMRRTEMIETQTHGTLHARMVGDAEEPVILYLHTPKEGSSSLEYNGLVMGVAEAMKNGRAKRVNEAKEEAEDAKLLGGVKLQGRSLSSLLAEEKFEQLVKALAKVSYAAGESVFVDGAKGDTCTYIIKMGNASLTAKGKDEPELLKEGDFFGEGALLNEESRIATVKAAESAMVCLMFDRKTFIDIVGPVHELLDSSTKRDSTKKQAKELGDKKEGGSAAAGDGGDKSKPAGKARSKKELADDSDAAVAMDTQFYHTRCEEWTPSRAPCRAASPRPRLVVKAMLRASMCVLIWQRPLVDCAAPFGA